MLEKNNPKIAVNLFLYNNEKDNISTMRQSPRRGGNIKVLNLLMLTHEKTDKHHYVWIKNMSRLIRRQANNNHQVFVCGNCLSVFKTKEKQERHVPRLPAQQPKRRETDSPGVSGSGNAAGRAQVCAPRAQAQGALGGLHGL